MHKIPARGRGCKVSRLFLSQEAEDLLVRIYESERIWLVHSSWLWAPEDNPDYAAITELVAGDFARSVGPHCQSHPAFRLTAGGADRAQFIIRKRRTEAWSAQRLLDVTASPSA